MLYSIHVILGFKLLYLGYFPVITPLNPVENLWLLSKVFNISSHLFTFYCFHINKH